MHTAHTYMQYTHARWAKPITFSMCDIIATV